MKTEEFLNKNGFKVNDDNRFDDCDLTWDAVIGLMADYRKEGRYYTEDEIRVIQEAAYEAGVNYQE